MKSTESKTSTAKSPQTQEATSFFFKKDVEQSFFSETKLQKDPFFSPNNIQAKLSIGQAGDKYEQEADAMADQVVQKLAENNIQPKSNSETSTLQNQAPFAGSSIQSVTPSLQLKCAECAQEEQLQPKEEDPLEETLQMKPIFDSNAEPPEEGTFQRKCSVCGKEASIQRKGNSDPSSASPDLENQLNSTKGGGSPLPEGTRNQMEGAFGADFSGVRVHTNGGAMQMNKELGAQAFTHGSDVYFNSGKYDPGSTEGNRLLGHELTHVVQQGATEQSDGKQSRIQKRATIFDIQCSEESDLIDQNTSWGNLDETALGLVLVQRAQQGNFLIINRVLDQLGSTNRDDVSYEIIRQTSNEILSGFVHSAQGRQMLDRLYDELSSGSFGDEERQQANRIIYAKEAAIAITSRPQDLGNIKIFPFKLPGVTVFRDAPIDAERRGEGRIWVNMPVRVLATDGFQAETRTLPTEVFTSGIELPENETIGVRMYDLGGELHVRSALYLVQLANETNTQVLQSMAEVGAIGLTLGSGALVAGATEGSMAVRGLVALGISASRAASVVLVADRAAFAIGLITTTLRDHRGWILEQFPSTGRQFMDYVEFANRMIAIYGMARFVIELPNLLRGFRSANSRWRQSRSKGELNTSQQQAIQGINSRTDEFLDGAQQIQQLNQANLFQRQRGNAAIREAEGLEREVQQLLERASTETNVQRATRMRQRSERLQQGADRLRAEGREFLSGERSATDMLPTEEEIEVAFQNGTLTVETNRLIQIPLSVSERNPALLPRLLRPLLRSRTGNRVAFRVEGGGSRTLISLSQNGDVAIQGGSSIHINFGSDERAVEFIQANRGAGARIIIFEVDEQWVQSVRSASIPEHNTGSLTGQPRLVDVRFADDQIEIPGNLIDEFEDFIIPGSGRSVESLDDLASTIP